MSSHATPAARAACCQLLRAAQAESARPGLRLSGVERPPPRADPRLPAARPNAARCRGLAEEPVENVHNLNAKIYNLKSGLEVPRRARSPLFDPIVVLAHLQLAGGVRCRGTLWRAGCICRALAVTMPVTGPSIAAATAQALFLPLAHSNSWRASRIVPTPIVMA